MHISLFLGAPSRFVWSRVILLLASRSAGAVHAASAIGCIGSSKEARLDKMKDNRRMSLDTRSLYHVPGFLESFWSWGRAVGSQPYEN